MGHQNPLEGGLVETRMAVSGSAGLECGLRTYISNKLPGEAEAEVDQGPPLGNHCTEGVSWELFISPSGSQAGCTLESPGSFPKCYPGPNESNLWEWNLGIGSLTTFPM